MWIHRYTLTPRQPLNARTDASPRRGVLLRDDDGGVADVHPWPELGDAPLDEQLALLARGETTALTHCSLAMARVDGAARRRGVSLFADLAMPPCHWPLAAGDVPEAFDTVKVKLGPGETIPPGLDAYKLRLDFNATLDEERYRGFVNTLTKWNLVEFVEDPLPYDAEAWRRVRSLGLPLALDRDLAFDGVDYLVVKPAIQDVEEALTTDLPLVVTSYMDHPVGQLHAAHVAASAMARYPRQLRQCGLLTHLLYEPDPFIDRLALDGNTLARPAGTGIGFDDLLASIDWEPLA